LKDAVKPIAAAAPLLSEEGLGEVSPLGLTARTARVSRALGVKDAVKPSTAATPLLSEEGLGEVLLVGLTVFGRDLPRPLLGKEGSYLLQCGRSC
jgi:hypothetical protein